MSKSGNSAKIEFILKMINDLEDIVKKYNNITNALTYREAQLAIMMCLMQVGETINKIDKEVLEKNNLLLDAKGAYSIRNFIAHDYDGVELSKIEEVIRYNIPKLKEKLQKIRL